MRSAGRALGQVVLIADRTFTGPDPAARLAGLSSDGYGVTWRRLPAEDRPDLAVVRLRLPRTVEPGAPSAAMVDLSLSGGQATAEPSLRVEVSGPGGTTTAEAPISVPPGLEPWADGRRYWTARVELPSRVQGHHQVSVCAQLAGDTVSENDCAGDPLWVGDGHLGLVVSSGPVTPVTLGWLAGELPGIQLLACPIEEVPRRLTGSDLLVTVDIGPADLPEGLGDWVRGGGGWVAFLGWGSLGAWERHGVGEPTDLLPLQPAQDSGEERDVILLVDGSGSMEGEPFERVKHAVFELIPSAQASDTIQLRFFTEVLHGVEFESKGRSAAERRGELAPLLDARVPSGGTDIGYSLERLAETRTSWERPGLVLILTDGVGSTGLARDARRALAAARLDLRVLRIGDQPKGLAFLQGLLLPGEEIVEAGDLSSLGQQLQLEVNRHRVRDAPHMSGAPVPATGTLGAALLPAMTAVASLPGDWAPLDRYTRAEVAGEAEVLWRSSVEAEPLLAVHRVGSGLVAASATHPGWAPFLAARPALGEVLFRAAARGRPREVPRLVDGAGGLALEGCPAEWPLDLELEIRLPTEPSGYGESEEGPPLGRLKLLPGPGGSDLDPRTRRTSLERSILGGLTRGTGLEGLLVAEGKRLLTLPLVAAGPAEWMGGGRALVLDPPLPPVEPGPGLAFSAPHPAAAWVLGAGIAVLGLAALLALFGGQGIAGSGRS